MDLLNSVFSSYGDKSVHLSPHEYLLCSPQNDIPCLFPPPHASDGDWSYAVAVSASDLEDGHKIVIGTLETVVRAREVLGNARVVPIYLEVLEVSDRVRLSRAISREELSSKPNYYEICRRFLDEKDAYSDDKLIMGGIMRKYRFYNDNLASTLHEVEEFIKANG